MKDNINTTPNLRKKRKNSTHAVMVTMLQINLPLSSFPTTGCGFCHGHSPSRFRCPGIPFLSAASGTSSSDTAADEAGNVCGSALESGMPMGVPQTRVAAARARSPGVTRMVGVDAGVRWRRDAGGWWCGDVSLLLLMPGEAVAKAQGEGGEEEEEEEEDSQCAKGTLVEVLTNGVAVNVYVPWLR
jgi:hypothetical protein